jgi:hypothetical protein
MTKSTPKLPASSKMQMPSSAAKPAIKKAVKGVAKKSTMKKGC